MAVWQRVQDAGWRLQAQSNNNHRHSDNHQHQCRNHQRQSTHEPAATRVQDDQTNGMPWGERMSEMGVSEIDSEDAASSSVDNRAPLSCGRQPVFPWPAISQQESADKPNKPGQKKPARHDDDAAD